MASKRGLDETAPDVKAAASKPRKRHQFAKPSSFKKSDGDADVDTRQNAPTDPTYGQRYAFPSLAGQLLIDEDVEIEDERDAQEYLRSVQLEASGIPHLLVAPKAGPATPPQASASSLPWDDDEPDAMGALDGDDPRGFYEDGTYVAAPDAEIDETTDVTSTGGGGGNDEAAVQQAYFDSLLARFARLREQLHRKPPDWAAALATRHDDDDDDYDNGNTATTEVGQFGPRSGTFKTWSFQVRHTDPSPARVALMDKGSVLRLLRIILGGKFIRRGHVLRERTSRWVWALLARLPGRGELDHVEVAHLREMGKRAVLMGTSLAHMSALQEEVGAADFKAAAGGDEFSLDEVPSSPLVGGGDGGGGDGEYDGEVDDDVNRPVADGVVDQAPHKEEGEADDAERDTNDKEDGEVDSDHNAAAEQAAEEARVRLNAQATLNMILTVVGELYGQRDLLEFRNAFQGS